MHAAIVAACSGSPPQCSTFSSSHMALGCYTALFRLHKAVATSPMIQAVYSHWESVAQLSTTSKLQRQSYSYPQ